MEGWREGGQTVACVPLLITPEAWVALHRNDEKSQEGGREKGREGEREGGRTDNTG